MAIDHDRQDGSLRAAVPVVAEVKNVSKTFGTTRVLRDVSVSIPTGDSRALVGRNGAGKSTLVAILNGLLVPDAGEVRLAGEPAPGVGQRAEWHKRVACVFQRSSVIPNLTVAENLFLNAQPGRGGWISWAALRREARRVLDEWELDVDVDVDAGRLSVEQRQIVEIARALRQGSRFIILDEPTAELEGREVSRLFERIVRLQESGVTFLYISHHLHEIYEVCNSVTVLRDGQVVAQSALRDMPRNEVVAAMVGDAARDLPAKQAHVPREGGEASGRERRMLAVSGLRIAGEVDGVDLAIVAGECVGLAGLAGSGKEHVAKAIAGLVAPDGGTIAVDGAPLRPGDVLDARRKGVGYVPRDRHGDGIVPLLSVAENLTLTTSDTLGPAGVVLPARRDERARRLVDAFQIVTASPRQPIGELSGGNQQKCVMGRALSSAPKLLVLVSPTQGVDIASKAALFEIIEEARGRGTSVLIVSDDLDELIVCDRVAVIFKGRVTGEFAAGWRDKKLVAAIEGVGTE
jgi:simple sugar transport system ATP-binding protein